MLHVYEAELEGRVLELSDTICPPNKLTEMDAAAHGYAVERAKEHPDNAVLEQLYKVLIDKMGATHVAPEEGLAFGGGLAHLRPPARQLTNPW